MVDDWIGEVLEGTSYRLLEVIGRGGSAVVYRAEHTKLRTRVIVKLMNQTMTADPERAGRMRLEAQALARLVHPNLVAVTDSGIARDRLFFVMDDDGGVSLESALGHSGHLSASDAVKVTSDVLEGLAFIHESGLVHRDVHPNNLLVCTHPDGRRSVRILDLGLLKVLSGTEQHQLGPLPVPTAEGTTLGTPRYMAPEQARGAAVDARSDLYAVGCVLYRLLAGRDPYAHHATTGQVLAAQLGEPIRPPSEVAPTLGIGSALERVVLRALAKSPEARFGSAREMMEALGEALALDELAEARGAALAHGGGGGLAATVALPESTPSPEVAVRHATTPMPARTALAAEERSAARTQGVEPAFRETPLPFSTPQPLASFGPPPMPVVTTSEEPTLRRQKGSGSPASGAGGASRGAVALAFVGSWVGFLVVTLLLLVATKGCGTSSVVMMKGAAGGPRLSSR